MIFVFDLDDTICDTDGYSEQYIKNFFAANNWPYKQIATSTRFAEAKFDWDLPTALKWYKEFGDRMMAEFPCKPGAVKFLQTLKKNGHKIVISTARATDWHTEPEKITKQWLTDNKIPYDKIYIGRVDKEAICKEVNADVFVDDDLKIVERVATYFASISKNKKTFLSTTDYNKDFPIPNDVVRVNDFSDLSKQVGIVKHK